MNAIRKILYKIDDQRGSSAVEFAIILPLLVIFVFGIIEFSILFYNKAMITNASREGARKGILFQDPRVTGPEIENVVNTYSSGRLITFAAGNPDPDTEVYRNGVLDAVCENRNDQLTVRVTYPYEFLLLPNFLAIPFFPSGGGLPGTISIQAITEMRCE